MSYVAYFASGAPAARRPIMFVWDGGPGSSTRPMLLGSFAPVVKAAPSSSSSSPGVRGVAVRPNPDTLLDATDLVFVDAPGTGFGQIEGCAQSEAFFSIDGDATAFEQFVKQFLRRYSRQASPLFLFGESYGTLRAAVVARRLEESGRTVAGVVLLSQYLAADADPAGALGNPGTENPYFLTFPSYAATAWAHRRVAASGDLKSWLAEVEQFSTNAYAAALLQGEDLTLDSKRRLSERLAHYSGLPAQTWFDANMRIESSRFLSLLEADQGKIVGREDTRLDGPTPATRGTAVEDDPALKISRATTLAAFQEYVRGTLRLGDRTFTPDIAVHWDMRHVTDPNGGDPTYVNAGPDLVAALTANPSMRVIFMSGYFDLSTPYFGTPYLIKHLGLPPALRAHVAWREYPSGHSAYSDDAVRSNMHDSIAELVSSSETLGRPPLPAFDGMPPGK